MPRQLPVSVATFVGRTGPLAELDQLLAASDRCPTVVISAVSGTAGVGKSALALHWAHQVADRFEDGTLFVNLRGFDPTGPPMPPTDVVRGFLTALGVVPERIPADLDAQVGLYRSVMAGRRILIVLDNAFSADQVRPLLPGTPGCLVLVTSRNQLTGLAVTENAHPLRLDLLTVAEASALLAARLGEDRVAADSAALERIIGACARLPLALAVVAARAVTRPWFALDSLASELAEARLDRLSAGDPATDVRAVLSWSYQRLRPGPARLFQLLGLHPGPDLRVAAAASVFGCPPAEARQLLADLAHANLLIEHSPGRYSWHDLLRTYARETAETLGPDERQHAVGRILDHYLHSAHCAAVLLAPHRDRITPTAPRIGVQLEEITDSRSAITWLTEEHSVLLAAIRQATVAGFDTHTWQLAWALSYFHSLQGYGPEALSSQHAALAAVDRTGDHTGQALIRRTLAETCIRLDRYQDADRYATQALAGYSALGDRTGIAWTHRTLAWTAERQGRLTEELQHAERALELFRELGNLPVQGRALNTAGWAHANAGDYQRALSYCQQALELLRQFDDQLGQAMALDSIGYCHHHLGEHSQAVRCFEQALDLERSSGDRYCEAETLEHLGDVWHATGEPSAADRSWQAALEIFEELGHASADAIRAKLNAAGR